MITTDEDVERVWKDFWLPMLLKDGQVDMEQVKKELFDYHTALQNVPLVYDYITHGRLTKLNTRASVIMDILFADECRRSQ